MTSHPGSDTDKVVRIPAALFALIEQRARETEFESAEAYIIFVLTEIAQPDETIQESVELSDDDEAKIFERLRGLGYIE